jgi:hypothetical protein
VEHDTEALTLVSTARFIGKTCPESMLHNSNLNMPILANRYDLPATAINIDTMTDILPTLTSDRSLASGLNALL